MPPHSLVDGPPRVRHPDFAGWALAAAPVLAYARRMAADIETARARLAARRAELEGLSAMSEGARATVELDQQAVGRLSRMDALQAQAMAAAQERTRRRELQRIAAAERRIVSDDYGYCTECGDEIPDGRLAIDPAADRCVGCAG